MELSRVNNNTKWKDAEDIERKQLIEYKTFVDLEPDGEAPPGYKKIRCHIIYNVKHHGRHLTDPNTESVYSGAVSLCGIRLIVFLAELNGLELWGADVGAAYLEAKTEEKVYIVSGPEFGPLEGHTLLIDKALCGLRSPGLCWHQRFADVLCDIAFTPRKAEADSKAEADIWMREGDGVFEYIAVYVDDLMIAARYPEAIVQTLQENHGFNLKSVGRLTYHF
jgi:Reverse transcriptase (RNA-dependent DNA polymerase)